MAETDTIFALSSGRPPAAVSIIRVSGPKAHEAGRKICGSLPEARSAVLRELRDPRSGELIDEGLVLRFDCPSSFTGEDTIEFQCHGGRAIVDALLAALTSLEGLRPADPGEFTRRAFEHGRIDLTEAEGLADLIEAETQSQRKAALAMAEGGLSRQVSLWQEQLLALSAEAERAIDYDEDDERLDCALLVRCGQLESELRSWLEKPRVERLKAGVRVVIAGPPNVGKSSLINAIAGEERAIVTDVPGTTRDHIEVPLSLGGVPVLLTDTAGLRQTDDQVELIGVGRATCLIEAADILLWLGEAREAPERSDMIKVHSKSDLPGRTHAPEGSLAVSANSHAGLADLLVEVEAHARRLLPADDGIALNRRQAENLEEAASALHRATEAALLILLAEELRIARNAFERLTGRSGVEDLLDALFSRFCLGK